jgi:hypothetical protein
MLQSTTGPTNFPGDLGVLGGVAYVTVVSEDSVAVAVAR